jgi:hypothetical protein
MSAANKILQAAAGNAAGDRIYVDDVFSTFLYAGNDSTNQIQNGLDLSGEGGMVWIKSRSSGAMQNVITDTERGVNKNLVVEQQYAQNTDPSINSFNSDGFTLNTIYSDWNDTGHDYVSWAFRKQAGFFDVVTYTGNGTAGRTVSHNLGSVPGLMIIKNTAFAEEWTVYHRSEGATKALRLDSTQASSTSSSRFNNTEPTATEFTVGAFESVNRSGDTIVAYLFAHDDQSFGDNSDESIIQCGSYTGNATTREIDLGFEPQWILLKKTNSTEDWYIIDVMRGMAWPPSSSAQAYLRPNLSAAESANADNYPHATSNGFRLTFESSTNTSGANYIYVAIRRPMKTPEAGTEVFKAVTYNGADNATQEISAGFPIDMDLIRIRTASADRDSLFHTRLLGKTFLKSTTTSAEASFSDNVVDFSVGQNVIELPAGTGTNEINGASSSSYIAWLFKRAAGFFDVVAYTGTGANTTVSHNLNAVPELIITKQRTVTYDWYVYAAPLGNTKYLVLNNTDAEATDASAYNSTTPTSSVFSLGTQHRTNQVNKTFIAYLFGTVAGVSKVGSYTGTGSTINVDCGFSSGARFILIKRTDSTGGWYVWDSTRGINAGSEENIEIDGTADPSSVDDIDPLSSGFQVVSTNAEINASGGTYIFLAIA